MRNLFAHPDSFDRNRVTHLFLLISVSSVSPVAHSLSIRVVRREIPLSVFFFFYNSDKIAARDLFICHCGKCIIVVNLSGAFRLTLPLSLSLSFFTRYAIIKCYTVDEHGAATRQIRILNRELMPVVSLETV